MHSQASIAVLIGAAMLMAACGKPASPPAPIKPAPTATQAPTAAAATFPPLSAAALAACSQTSPASAKGGTLPAYLAFLPCVENVQVSQHKDWDEDQFPPEPWVTPGPDTIKQGKHWHIYGQVNDGGADNHTAWAGLKRGFLAAGWQPVKAFDNTQPLMEVMRFNKGGVDVWAAISINAPPAANVDVVEVAPLPVNLTLAQPAPTPEKVVPETGDFAFLAPMPGSTPHGGHHDPSPLYVTLPGASQPEIIAPDSVIKAYRPSDDVSLLEWFTLYHGALLKAGWTIISESHSADAAITAHYGQNGRNIWAYLHMNVDGYDFQVGDEGGASGGLGASLAKDCHVALTGVLFDFNKSTLKPESDPVLQKVSDLIAKDAALKLEVQGHTDNVGSDAYNQTLSEARAGAVVAWLTQHGAAAGRLTSKGYGKTMPVADNNTDEGRAKNRRVEIANPACAPRRK